MAELGWVHWKPQLNQKPFWGLGLLPLLYAHYQHLERFDFDTPCTKMSCRSNQAVNRIFKLNYKII